ncbi:MAG: GAF domain-containing protein [Vicinamibacterales bacterium]
MQRAHGDRERAHDDLQRTQGERERAQQELQRAREALDRAQADVQSAQADVESTREHTSRELEQARQRHTMERASAADALDQARQAAESMPRDASELLISMRAIDDATSLTDALSAAVRGAALESPRASLFIVNGTVLQEWPVDGVPPVHAGPIRATGGEAGFLGEVLRTGETVTLDGTNDQRAPMFAGLPAGRRAIAVPFVLDGRPVAVLYADEGSDGKPLASWLETVQILGRHATSVVTSLTAVRTAQAMGLVARGAAGANRIDSSVGETASPTANDDEVQGARRYARLLVSEIKLYNEGAVRVGRERRDLRTRLHDEIDRARRLYEQRIGSSVPDRDTHFQQELVQTLADGDASLLG